MTLTDPDLWTRLDADPLTMSSGKTLEAQIAGMGGLGRQKAAVAVREYRRFLYLAATGREVVVPSPLVDWIWHKHLEDTRAYAEDFCPRIFGRMIHHNPGRVRAADDPCYDRTRERIGATFGAVHPRVWPDRAILARGRWVGFWFIAPIAFAILLAKNDLWSIALPVGLASLLPVLWWQMKGPWTGGSSSGGCGSGCSGDGDGCGGD
ncbi:hypothetical protein OU426_08750 [Frigidibacter sp. RF13]|uniref:glycine-rich domain-containing protein n=1 Tax=Frigidibacter sp. RF13 TaxID=2997340 RepID=UPI0022714B90|nr:hypothetical protein [Frigidibacter sp. RF13]MCY1126941.1 hypothetical protein [Frigidibacter sp. RF13]